MKLQRRRLVGAMQALPMLWLPGLSVAAPAQPGQPVVWPEVKLLDGSRWSADNTRGKPVVVVFWSLTCPFCLRHNAHISKLQASPAGQTLEILTVARERDARAVQSYLTQNTYHFAVTLDNASMAAALTQRRMIPLTVTVGRDGRLRQVIPGEMSEDDVMELARELG
jgi:thiol-disulfide isomerase/thioredoxin